MKRVVTAARVATKFVRRSSRAVRNITEQTPSWLVPYIVSQLPSELWRRPLVKTLEIGVAVTYSLVGVEDA